MATEVLIEIRGTKAAISGYKEGRNCCFPTSSVSHHLGHVGLQLSPEQAFPLKPLFLPSFQQQAKNFSDRCLSTKAMLLYNQSLIYLAFLTNVQIYLYSYHHTFKPSAHLWVNSEWLGSFTFAHVLLKMNKQGGGSSAGVLSLGISKSPGWVDKSMCLFCLYLTTCMTQRSTQKDENRDQLPHKRSQCMCPWFLMLWSSLQGQLWLGLGISILK